MWRGAWQRKCLADFCKALNVETAEHNALAGDAFGALGAAAELLWTSDLKFEGMPPAHCKPFYAMLNLALLQDVHELMAPAAGFARAINDSLLVTSRTKPERQRFPPHNRTWRGGGLGIAGHVSLSPDALLAFFTPGKKYRQPAFLATTFDQSVAEGFIQDAIDDGAKCTVLWVVHFDPNGRRIDENGTAYPDFDDSVRVKHVNYISKSHFEDSQGQ